MTAPEPAPKPLVERLREAAIAQRKAAYLPHHTEVADLLESYRFAPFVDGKTL